MVRGCEFRTPDSCSGKLMGRVLLVAGPALCSTSGVGGRSLAPSCRKSFSVKLRKSGLIICGKGNLSSPSAVPLIIDYDL